MSWKKELNDYGPDRSATGFVLKWMLWGFLIIAILSVLGVGSGWVLGWLFVPAQITSPQNVREQWAFAYQYDESLQAAARQICSTEKALALATSDTEKEQRRSQLLAYEQNYARIEADYNARLRNAFQAKLVAPADVPRTAPTLVEMKPRICR